MSGADTGRSRSPKRAKGTGDPARAVKLMLGESERYEITSGGFVIALGLHIAFLGFAILTTLLAQMRTAMAEERMKVHDFFWRTYDVEVDKPKDPPKDDPPPLPDPPPEPAPKAVKAQAKPAEDDPYKNLPPAPAASKAGKVLTTEPKPDAKDEPVELPTIVSGEGTAVGGMQAGDGKGDGIVKQRGATASGTPGGTGTGTAAAAAGGPPAADRSRPISLVGGAWRCPFPPEADADQIDKAVVGVQVTVRPDGSAASVTVLNDPGHGFGRAAKNCAMSSRYNPAFDRTGAAVLQSQPVNITFRR